MAKNIIMIIFVAFSSMMWAFCSNLQSNTSNNNNEINIIQFLSKEKVNL